MSKSEGSAGSITDAHKDKWTIESDSFPGFVRFLATTLFEQLTVNELPAHLLEMYNIKSLNERLSISYEFRDVSYVDRSVTITAPEEFDVSAIQGMSESIAFMKPKRFEPEQEVRIVFWLMFDDKKISIVDQPKSISLRPINKFL